MVSVPEAATRVAMLERGEADIIYFVPGELIDRVKSNPKVTLAPVVSGNWWLEFPGFQDPKNPFHDKRVRQAISLAIDRDAINQAECDGMGVVDGNWINNDVEYGIEWPKWEHNVGKAKQLMAEAGFPNGFNVDWITPVPNYYSRGERVVAQLQSIGIRSRLQVMERGVFLKRLQGGLKEWPGVQIIMNAARVGGTWSNWYNSFMRMRRLQRQGSQSACRRSTTNSPSTSPRPTATNGKNLAERDPAGDPRELLFRPGFRHAFVNAYRPALAAKKWQDVFPTNVTGGYAYPWEDLELNRDRLGEKEGRGRAMTSVRSGMGQFMIRRTLYAVVTLFILSLTIFTVVRLTGDPVTLLAEPGARAEDLDRVRTEWGLDRPWPVQYLAFVKNVFTGELGKSFNYEMPVSTLYFQRLPNSLELALAAT